MFQIETDYQHLIIDIQAKPHFRGSFVSLFSIFLMPSDISAQFYRFIS